MVLVLWFVVRLSAGTKRRSYGAVVAPGNQPDPPQACLLGRLSVTLRISTARDSIVGLSAGIMDS